MISPYQDHLPDMVMKQRYKICPSCRHFIPMSARGIFCLVCGGKLIEECPRCREPILYPLAKFCPVCGNALVKSDDSNR